MGLFARGLHQWPPQQLSGKGNSLETEELVWSSSGERQNYTSFFLALEMFVPTMLRVRDTGTKHGSLHSAPLHLWCWKLSETVLRFFYPKPFKDFAKISYFILIKGKQNIVRVNKISARKYSDVTMKHAGNEIASVLAQ